MNLKMPLSSDIGYLETNRLISTETPGNKAQHSSLSSYEQGPGAEIS